MKWDAIVVGAGPAGAVASTVLARAGARVLMIDRASFPRDKLCGDTVNPGALMALAELGLAAPAEERGLLVTGMRVTGPTGVVIEGRYPAGLHGRALWRRDMDWSLVQEAMAAGVQFEPGVAVRHAIVDATRTSRPVAGVVIGLKGQGREFRAPVTIAADGRRSTLAFALGLARHPPRPRRWAVGTYFENVHGMSSFGEMHIRRGRYIGIAPIAGGLANVCLVRPFERAAGTPAPAFESVLAAELAGDRWLRDRFADARPLRPPVVLGPLAVDVSEAHPAGLLLAGDAAGFIDPMTGDGLRFAVRGGALAGGAALEALTNGWTGVHGRLAAARAREFAAKWRFNRALRSMVSYPSIVVGSACAARLLPGVLQRVIRTAGDCGAAALQ